MKGHRSLRRASIFEFLSTHFYHSEPDRKHEVRLQNRKRCEFGLSYI
ncbi:hypothetical protein NBRC3293_2111 [Gluconobacter oxydans NBRC 3293]|uniref:Uncharacterized protein n=1 Tax=Gluconobacter oxydans NBRC 3293 TaxID=1315969 RepID=A0A829WWT7_GLUOY|nr:hypothetical protein NBRC3293_2111 [Gluconobacter oxydans NBRC 3293]